MPMAVGVVAGVAVAAVLVLIGPFKLVGSSIPWICSEAAAGQQLAANGPEIVKAGASAFDNVDDMVPPDGADGMADLFAEALTVGGTGLGPARRLRASTDRTGQAPQDTSALNGQARKVPTGDRCPVGRDHGGSL
jgi:hypothetical protein